MTNKFLRDDGQFASLVSAGSSATGPITVITNSTTADIVIATASFSTGPSVAQGSSGIWLAVGNITFATSAAGGGSVGAKLWDGTTVIDSGVATVGAVANGNISLSGILASPAGNLRISAQASISSAMITTAGAAVGSVPNTCTITAIRIG